MIRQDDADDNKEEAEVDDDNINDKQPESSTKEPDYGFQWRKRDIPSTTVRCEPDVDEVEEIMPPLEYFKRFWHDELNKLVVEQTSLYSTQKTTSPVCTTTEKLEKIIGMHMKMGIIQPPSI